MMLGKHTHTAEPLVSPPTSFEVETAIDKRNEDTNHQVLLKFWQN